MTTQLTSAGFQRDGLDVILAKYQAAMIAIFGPSINLDPDTQDGQMLGIFSEGISNEDQLAEAVYNSFNPSLATGSGLSRLVQLNGISRIGGAYSVAKVTFTGIANTVIPALTLVGNPSTQDQFSTVAEATIGSNGTVLVAVISTVMGAVSAPANSITKLVTPQFGVSSVANPSSATIGRSQETDTDLRIRRAKSVAIASQSLVDSLEGGLLSVANVTNCIVLENATEATDSNGLPPHSVCCIVSGGSDSDVAQMIWLLKSLGVTLFGTSSNVAIDNKGRSHTISFSRPISVPVYINIAISKKDGYPSTAPADIASAIVSWGSLNQDIGGEVIYSRIYEPINSIAGFSVSDLQIGRTNSSMQTSNIPMGYSELASFELINIVVTVL
ncbi:MAG: baseplate J/gp47 family protein [Pseudomonadota bacterium]